MSATTPRFKFGETPMEVIRGRWNNIAKHTRGDNVTVLFCDGRSRFGFRYFDELEIALVGATRMAVLSDQREERDRAYRFRLDLLAALNIDEGGE